MWYLMESNSVSLRCDDVEQQHYYVEDVWFVHQPQIDKYIHIVPGCCLSILSGSHVVLEAPQQAGLVLCWSHPLRFWFQRLKVSLSLLQLLWFLVGLAGHGEQHILSWSAVTSKAF